MEKKKSIFVGIDIGTQGVRAIAINSNGELLVETKSDFLLNGFSRQEQSPLQWWSSTVSCLQQLTRKLKNQFETLEMVKALSITSTSGTVIPLDAQHQPIHNAIMYSDNRSSKEAEVCKQAAESADGEGYKSFNSSCGLPKIVWFMNQYPHQIEKIDTWSHASDFILGNLSGVWNVSDYTNVLKTGYDLVNKKWPSYIYDQLRVQKSWLPEVVPSGTPIGTILPEIAEVVGLPASVVITAGMTDGCASQIASGAVDLGEWNTTIGTTLVVKGVSKNKINDPFGRIYSHLHPAGLWMPGGASNIGADWVTKNYQNHNLDYLNSEAEKKIPTPFFSYPLLQEGERFPFISKNAHGFISEGLSDTEAYAASMEGVAYIERYAYELIESLAREKVKTVFTAGGASNSKVWMRIRSNVLDKPIVKMKYTTGAVGAAILAASQTYFTTLQEAGHQLTQQEMQIDPGNLVSQYEENYQQFIEQLIKRGYIKRGEIIG